MIIRGQLSRKFDKECLIPYMPSFDNDDQDVIDSEVAQNQIISARDQAPSLDMDKAVIVTSKSCLYFQYIMCVQGTQRESLCKLN